MWVNESLEKWNQRVLERARRHETITPQDFKRIHDKHSHFFLSNVNVWEAEKEKVKVPWQGVESPPMLETRLAKSFSTLIVSYMIYPGAAPASVQSPAAGVAPRTAIKPLYYMYWNSSLVYRSFPK
jgi:hypothetical protein